MDIRYPIDPANGRAPAAPTLDEFRPERLAPWRILAFALISTGCTLWLRLALDGPLDAQPTLVLFTLPIMLSAYVGGLRGGLVATVVSCLAVAYFLLPPLHSFGMPPGSARWQLFLLALSGVVISVLNETLHRARRRADFWAGQERQATEREQLGEREQRQLASRLEVEKGRLIAAQAVALTGSWETDLSTLEVLWSDETHRIFETDAATFQPDHAAFLAALHPDDRAQVDDAFVRSIADGDPQQIEHRLLMPDGRIKFVEERWQSFSDADGHPVRAVGTCQDISQRRSTEQALRDSNEKFRQLADNIVDAFWIRSADMNEVHYISPAFERIWGRTTESLYANPREWSSFIVPEDRQRVLESFATLMGDVDELDLEYRILRLDGEIRWVRVRAFQVRDARHQLIRHAGIVTDITERRAAADALRTSMEEFRTLAEALPHIVWITTVDGANVYCNQQWTDYTGLTREEGAGDGWMGVFHPDDRQRGQHAWERTVATSVSQSTECRLRRADGMYRWWLIRGAPMRDAAGDIVKWMGTCTDIHDLKIADLEVLRINRALKTLSRCNEALARVEHEQELLEEVCRIAVETGGYRLAWVGYAHDDAERSITPVAYAGEVDESLSTYRASWNEHDPLGQGAAGEVIRKGRAVVSAGDDAESAFRARGERVRSHRGVIRLPLRDEHRTFGLLGLYSPDVSEASTEELALLQAMADGLASGVGHLRARSEQHRVQTAVVKVAVGVSAASGTQFFEQLARNMAEALGAQAGFVAELHPGTPASARTIAAVVNGELTDNFDYVIAGTPCERLLTSDTCVMAEGVGEQFPQSPRLAALGAQAYVGRRLDSSSGQPLGLLFVVFQEPLQHVEFITSTFQIFAARAASEMERLHTDAQVREQAALLDIAHDAILVKDLDNRIIYWNKGAERIFGWTAAEALGRDSVALLDGDGDEFGAASATLMRQGAWEGEMNKRTKDGRRIVVLVRWTLVRDAAGRPKSILGINTDITATKELEAQFLRAQRMESIGTMASGIAHDLNNVLTPILMSIEMLKEVVADDEDLEMLATMQGSAQRGAELVGQVLSFARGVEGRRITVNPLHVLRDLFKVMRETFPKSVVLRWTSARDLWTITGDPTQMYQVLLNLCVNARDAMPAGGNLTITAENVVLDEASAALPPEMRPGSYVLLKVKDTGTGIAAAIRDRIFEPFFTTKAIGDGTGLGLSTTQAIVRSHGGWVQLHSEVGKGSTFSVYLAADPSRPAADPVEDDASRLWLGQGELILVVDDETAIRHVAQRLLERFGYRVVLASNGAEAVALYTRRAAEIAAVLTDMAMPVMDGVATIRALRLLDPAVKIVGSSGLATGATFGMGVGEGVEHFVSKPYSADTLLRTLHDVLHGPGTPRT